MIVSSGGTRKGELARSAELVVELAKEQGVFFAIAFLFDIGYTRADIAELLPYLQREKGAINPNRKRSTDA